MAKKAKKGGKAKKGKKDKAEEVVPTEWDTKTMAEIEDDKRLLLEKLEEARMQRNYFQQERVRTADFFVVRRTTMIPHHWHTTSAFFFALFVGVAFDFGWSPPGSPMVCVLWIPGHGSTIL